jgi:hypothetical protein
MHSLDEEIQQLRQPAPSHPSLPPRRRGPPSADKRIILQIKNRISQQARTKGIPPKKSQEHRSQEKSFLSAGSSVPSSRGRKARCIRVRASPTLVAKGFLLPFVFQLNLVKSI